MLRLTILFVCVLTLVIISKSTAQTTCDPVCAIYCLYGNVIDANGCPTCKCKTSPCRYEETPLKGYFCGHGINREDCPWTYRCIIGLNNAYAVCCPRRRRRPWERY